MKVYYDERYVSAGHDFDTTKKAREVAGLLAQMPQVTLTSPIAATPEELAMIHDPRYVQAVMTGGIGAESAGFPWDENYYQAVAASTGGVIDAAFTALKEGVAGSLSSGLHHARWAEGAGFCTFNGLALAAKMALGQTCGKVMRDAPTYPCKKVLILDLDAHCGGGTYDIVCEEPDIWQIDVATSPFDYYPCKSERHRLVVADSATDYLDTICEELEDILAEERFDLVLYNAGMDPHEDCDCGGMAGITTDVLRQREYLVFDWGRKHEIPIAFVLAGGYTGIALSNEELAHLHQLTAEAAVDGCMREGTTGCEVLLDEEPSAQADVAPSVYNDEPPLWKQSEGGIYTP